ncbi:MAG: ABC transporter permease [Clostridia bacterium]|nr:ABC transporter permease [Clostridia bacterium]
MELLKKIKNSVKNSLKSVLLNYKEFIGIYISIIIVQLLIGTWAMSTYTNYFANDEIFDKNYQYDVVVTGDNSTITRIANILRNDVQQTSSPISTFAESGKTLGIVVKDGQFDRFYEEYLREYDEASRIDYTLTPKYVYHSEIQKEITTSVVLIGVITFLVGILILSVMYSVRTNHYKFQYGIYMAFGADKKMLGSIAMNELLAINTLTLIPSAIVSYLLLLTVYAGTGVGIVITFPMLLIYIAVSYLIVLIAACTSVGGLFIKPPIALITTADNSNFVSSPRKSFNIFGKNMPLHYEMYTTWRFRKYIAKLVLGAVAFSVIFVTGIYCANMLKTENDASNEEFVISYRHSTMVEDLRDKANEEADSLLDSLLSLEHVDKVTFEQSKSFKTRLDHLLLTAGKEVAGSGYGVPSLDELEGYTRAINNCRYVCVNELALEMYDNIFEIEYLEGYDAARLVSDKNMVVVSEGLYGAKCFNFKPGDKIAVAILSSDASNLPLVSDPQDYLKMQINNCRFTYIEYTVGAVIHDTDASDSIIVGMNDAAYFNVTGERQAVSEMHVFVDAGIGLGEVTAVRDNVKAVMTEYPSWSTKTTNNAVYAIVDNRINLPGLLYLLSILVLMISPVVWIFSQVMFYKKREAEYKLLHAMGATMKEIGGIHLVSGGLIFLISFITNFALSRLLCYVIYRIFTSVLPHLGVMGMSVSFNSFVPVSVVLLYAGVSAICGCISSLIPYVLYRRKVMLEEKALEEQRIEL